MKKNIKIKTSSFRLSLTLKLELNSLINKDFIARRILERGRRDKVNRLKERSAFTLSRLPYQVNSAI
ncbi:hypothetical protein [Vibrio parahaemolyticus]|uniref:hypothetical protein n=1 Tax=Vibrio parahaemolyticus TaxID=670 RepID=UPI0033059EC1